MSAPARTLTMMAMVAFAASIATAAPIDLDALAHCGVNPSDGIQVSDVTGNMGGSTDCWGAFDGNDPGPSGDGFETNDMVFNYLAKWDDTDPLDDPHDIGLSITGIGTTMGTWEFTNGSLLGSDFMIVLKAANSPGYGVWLFSGADNASDAGNWLVAWDKDLSHLTVYVKGEFPPMPPDRMPEPGTLLLLGAGLLGAGWVRRRRS